MCHKTSQNILLFYFKYLFQAALILVTTMPCTFSPTVASDLSPKHKLPWCHRFGYTTRLNTKKQKRACYKSEAQNARRRPSTLSPACNHNTATGWITWIQIFSPRQKVKWPNDKAHNAQRPNALETGQQVVVPICCSSL